MSVGRAIGQAAAVAGVFGLGYAIGGRNNEAAEQLVLEAVRLLSESSAGYAKDDLEDVRRAIERGDLEEARRSLPSNVLPVRQADCHESGVPFAASEGALLRNCETGMTAVVATINANRTVQATIGGKLTAGAPGKAFSDPNAKTADCFLVYHNLESGSEPLAARMSFDCPRGESE